MRLSTYQASKHMQNQPDYVLAILLSTIFIANAVINIIILRTIPLNIYPSIYFVPRRGYMYIHTMYYIYYTNTTDELVMKYSSSIYAIAIQSPEA